MWRGIRSNSNFVKAIAMDDEHDDPDGKVLTMKRGILDMIGQPPSPAQPPSPPPREPVRQVPEPPPVVAADPAADLPEPLPRPGDRYQACARAANRPLLTLFFLLADQSEEGFAYTDLRRVRLIPADEPGSGPVIALKFVEAVTTEVRINGWNFPDLHNLIGGHRIAWLREWPAGRQARDPRATVISSIRIEEKKAGGRG
jgi:hypothetical protein